MHLHRLVGCIWTVVNASHLTSSLRPPSPSTNLKWSVPASILLNCAFLNAPLNKHGFAIYLTHLFAFFFDYVSWLPDSFEHQSTASARLRLFVRVFVQRQTGHSSIADRFRFEMCRSKSVRSPIDSNRIGSCQCSIGCSQYSKRNFVYSTFVCIFRLFDS